MSIGIAGAGAFGTALAISLAPQVPVTLWARDPTVAATLQTQRNHHRHLPDIAFPEELTVTSDMQQLAETNLVLLAVPTQQLRSLLDAHVAPLSARTLVLCCKGIELRTGLLPAEVVAEVLPGTSTALLSGPSFAVDIAKGLPTALTLATAQDECGQNLQAQLTSANLRLYRTTDLPGVGLGGALKNVIAIACGAAIGAGLGESARAALMTRGYAEMLRLALRREARPETLSGLSGFGDLTLTCTSEKSRNYRLGLALGQGEIFDPSLTVEGAATARAMAKLAHAEGLDMPITQTVVALLDGHLTAGKAADLLLSRPLKPE